ncbi:acetate uptake transporter family protein [Pseudonocardia sp.]|jgi:succinate-acetate transporter protein|uniref:acetate uptake transporter family protein n=1 Tax=Pseudonocardia sp. TaxID=60912 RepID=UPI003D0C541C
MTVENEAQAPVAEAAAPAAAPAGNPSLFALPCFLVGSITLGLWLVGYLPLTLPGGLIPAVFFASGIGVLLSGLWAARIGQSAVAGIFGMFGVFWLSFGFMVMGLVNGWFGVSATDATAAASQIQSLQATFLISWLVVLVVVTLATMRLPLAFTLLFVFVDIAVALVLAGVLGGSTAMFTGGGIAVFVFCLIGIYLFYDAMNQELGGRALPMGAPVVK